MEPKYKLHVIPQWLPMGGITIGHQIFYKGPGYEYVIPHELVHVAQQERDGLIRFMWRYFTSAAWRVRYEAPAYAVYVKNGTMTLDQTAEFLAGKLYWNPCTVEEARAAIAAEVAKLP